jgi:predicted transposase/invertase (TIGR01784 family)
MEAINLPESVYYATFPIQEQALKGEWNYELTAVYTIAVLDFLFDDFRAEDNLLHLVELKDELGRVFYNKLKFIYIELPKFKKTVEQLENHLDKWLYLLQNLARLDEPLPNLQEEVFVALFEAAEIANFSPDDRRIYQGSLKVFRDWYAIEMTARQEAMEQGFTRGREEEAISLICRQLTRHCRQEISENLRLRVATLPISVLESLSEDLLDFNGLTDLEIWLAARE